MNINDLNLQGSCVIEEAAVAVVGKLLRLTIVFECHLFYDYI